jgi:hypothetical protein
MPVELECDEGDVEPWLVNETADPCDEPAPFEEEDSRAFLVCGEEAAERAVQLVVVVAVAMVIGLCGVVVSVGVLRSLPVNREAAMQRISV